MTNEKIYYVKKSIDKYDNITYVVMEKYSYKEGFIIDEYNGQIYKNLYQAEQVLKYLNKQLNKN
jgi:hypothetical protein